MIRFVLSLIVFCLSFEAHADRRVCDQLLSSTALSTGENAESAQLSGPAQAFVNIIQLYVKQADSKLSGRAIDAILESKTFVNPLAANIDSFSKQVSKGIEQVRGLIDSKKWLEVKKRIQELASKLQSENKDRDEKEDETSGLFSIVDKYVAGHNVQSAASWYVLDDKVYVAVGSVDQNFYIFELKNDRLELLNKFYTENSITGSTTWFAIGDEVYVSIGSGKNIFHIFQLSSGRFTPILSNKLEFKGENSNIHSINSSLIWKAVGENVFVLGGSSDANLYFYKLAQSRLFIQKTIKTDSAVTQLSQFQSLEDRHFVSASSANKLILYELIEKGSDEKQIDLLQVQEIELPLTSTAPVWQVIDGKVFLALSSGEGYLHIFELAGGQLQERSAIKVSSKYISSSPAWYVDGSKAYIAVGAYDGNLYVYQFANSDLSLFGLKKTGKAIQKSPSWLNFKDDILVAVASTDEHIYLLKIEDGNLKDVALNKLSRGAHSAPALQMVGDKVFAAIGAGFDLNILKLDKLKKQGGQK